MLILDEATNSLDSENEGRVLDAIERRRTALTVVLIAHRLSTIRWADLIYVVEGGRVVESGTWSYLSAPRWPFPRPMHGAEPDHVICRARSGDERGESAE
jgi:ABC-type multidrug transport system fused ATPase/permease subunit